MTKIRKPFKTKAFRTTCFGNFFISLLGFCLFSFVYKAYFFLFECDVDLPLGLALRTVSQDILISDNLIQRDMHRELCGQEVTTVTNVH